MNKMGKKKFGLSLIELLIVITITSITFIMIFRVYGMIVQNTQRIDNIIKMSEQLNNLVTTLHAHTNAKSLDPYQTAFGGSISGFASVVALSNRNGSTDFISAGCTTDGCRPKIHINETAIDLVDQTQVQTKNISFFVIPQVIVSNDHAILDPQRADKIEYHHRQGFWIFGNMEPRHQISHKKIDPIHIQYFFPLDPPLSPGKNNKKK